jgi:hypothetical protein
VQPDDAYTGNIGVVTASLRSCDTIKAKRVLQCPECQHVSNR